MKTARSDAQSAAKRALLAREFEQIRKRGYAINRGEWEDDVAALAAPIFDAQEAVVASVGIILPHSRLTGATTALFSSLVTRAAKEISLRLGYVVPSASRLKRVS